MCASLPVISSKYADGAFDLVEEGKNGYIVDPEDTERFAACITKLFEEDDLVAMGAYSYKKAHEFAFEHVAEGCMKAVESIM